MDSFSEICLLSRTAWACRNPPPSGTASPWLYSEVAGATAASPVHVRHRGLCQNHSLCPSARHRGAMWCGHFCFCGHSGLPIAGHWIVRQSPEVRPTLTTRWAFGALQHRTPPSRRKRALACPQLVDYRWLYDAAFPSVVIRFQPLAYHGPRTMSSMVVLHSSTHLPCYRVPP